MHIAERSYLKFGTVSVNPNNITTVRRFQALPSGQSLYIWELSLPLPVLRTWLDPAASAPEFNVKLFEIS
jgi:hypothetical protein